MLVNHFFDDPFRQLYSMQRRLSRDFDRDFDRADKDFGRYYRPYDMLDTRSFLEDEFDSFIEPAFRSIREAPRRLSVREPDENATVYAKYEINHNGHVWKKTIEKEPGKEWKTHIEEFDTEERKKALKDQGSKRLQENQEAKSPSKEPTETSVGI